MLIRPRRLFFLGSSASIAAVFIGIFCRYVRAAPPRDHLLIMRSCFHRFVTRAVWTKERHKPVKTEDIMNAVELLGPALLEFLPAASTIENSSCAGAFLLAGLRKGVMSPWGIVFRSGETCEDGFRFSRFTSSAFLFQDLVKNEGFSYSLLSCYRDLPDFQRLLWLIEAENIGSTCLWDSQMTKHCVCLETLFFFWLKLKYWPLCVSVFQLLNLRHFLYKGHFSVFSFSEP